MRETVVPSKMYVGLRRHEGEQIAISLATGTAPNAAARCHSPSTTCATIGESASPAPATANPTLRAPSSPTRSPPCDGPERERDERGGDAAHERERDVGLAGLRGVGRVGRRGGGDGRGGRSREQDDERDGSLTAHARTLATPRVRGQNRGVGGLRAVVT